MTRALVSANGSLTTVAASAFLAAAHSWAFSHPVKA